MSVPRVGDTAASLFLSHSHQDKAIARQIYHHVLEAGVRCWLDEAEIGPGMSIIAAIEAAIAETDVLGVVLTANSVTSPWVQKELRAALHDEIESQDVRVVGILADDCELPMFLRDKLYVDIRSDFTAGINRLVDYLRGERFQIPIPRQQLVAQIVSRSDDSEWDWLGRGGRGIQRETTANLFRQLTDDELDGAVWIAWNLRAWGYKRFESQLVQLIARRTSSDRPTAQRILRRLVELGFLGLATDLDYRKHEQGYTREKLLVVLLRAARRAAICSDVPAACPNRLSALLAEGRSEQPCRILGARWLAYSFGRRSLQSHLHPSGHVFAAVSQREPATSWLFAAPDDDHPVQLHRQLDVDELQEIERLDSDMEEDILFVDLSTFDDLGVLVD